MKCIYEMNFDCGQMGSLEGIFTAEKEKMDALFGTAKEQNK